ncbi:hypothetical protein KJ972_01545, partial [Candidatus Micrarchaeota archaeon]|nr:hypothetical protein [Candidatus Micrarchaeota archaeon]
MGTVYYGISLFKKGWRKTKRGQNVEYEKMLDRLYLSLPKKALTKERFEMPKADAFLQGQKTIFKNFGGLAKILRRR